MKIPLVDLSLQYHSIRKDIDATMAAVIADTAFVGGRDNKYVRAFEEDFARFVGTEHCISCGNGTDSLEILLKAADIGPGDEVIVPAHSWISTAEVIGTVGAKPVFVDSVSPYFNIDPAKIESKVTPRTKAVIPVHLYGLPADMDPILDIARRCRLFVLEDCAQAHGATYKGRNVGTFGDAASFSFYPGKNLGAYGDAGAMVTNNEAIARSARRIANHGQLEKHDHLVEGRNSRMDGLQAAVLSVKLRHLKRWNEMRVENARYYAATLEDSGVEIPKTYSHAAHVYHLYVIRSARRNELRTELNSAGIATGIHYPKALPFLPPYRSIEHTSDAFPVAARDMEQILSLPMYPELTRQQIDRVAERIKRYLDGS